MKTLLRVLGLATLVGIGLQGAPLTLAQEVSDSGFYLRGDLGWSFVDWGGNTNEKDSAFIGGGGVGYQSSEYFRGDIRVDYSGVYQVGWWDTDVDMVTALGNLYFDIPTGTFMTPYVGAGAGYTWVSVSGDSDSGFTAAGMAGVAFGLTESIDLDLGFRFMNILANGDDPQAYQGLAGIRFGF